MALLAVGVQSACGFALLGPLANGGDAWQSAQIGYGLIYTEFFAPGGPVNLGDIGGPKNLAEGYRHNTPVIYYAFDANFLGYFGSNGVATVDSAFAIMSRAFTNNPVTGQYLTNGVDSLSANLSEYPPETLHINYEAQSLALTDLKSVTLHCLVEQMGLAEPERFTWTLAERFIPPGTTCAGGGTEYLVVQRNYPVADSLLNQLQYSSYVNDTLYTYFIQEFCTGPNPIAYTVPYNVDPYADVFTAVAANNADGLGIGGYYTGLTRDDVAGLRYLYSSTNVNTETAAFIGATVAGNNGVGAANLVTTNLGLAGPFITTSNLNQLLVFAKTNDPSLIPGTFPNVVVAGAVTNWVTITNWSIGSYLTQPPSYPAGTQLLVVFSNMVGTAFVPNFEDTFANVITNGNLTNYLPGAAFSPGIILNGNTFVLNYSPNTAETIQTVQIQQRPGFPAGTLYTNTTVQTVIISNQPSGEYFVLPPGQCGWKFVNQSPVWSVTYITNVITTATNASGFVGSQSIVTVFTNHTFLVQPINCVDVPFSTSLYQGIERVRFVRADYDSLLGQTFRPITNYYTMVEITNSQPVVQVFHRTVVAPDILLSAADDIAANTFDGTVVRNITFDQDNVLDANGLAGGTALPRLAGPGTINPRTTIIYNKIGDAFENGFFLTTFSTNAFVLEANQLPVLQWASFDASTNDPVLYPNGTSIANMQSQILVQVSPPPPVLPDGTNGVAYPPIVFTASGGAFSPSFTWGLVSGLGTLPSGMSLSGAGTLSGTPTQTGTFDVTIQLTDSLGRPVNWNYSITIH